MLMWFPHFVFTLVILILITLPFIPAWREWRTPTDCAPLLVPLNAISDPHYFSSQFRLAVQTEMTDKNNMPSIEFEYAPESASKIDWSGTAIPLIAANNVRFGSDAHCIRPLFTKQNFDAGSGNRFHSILANGDISFGEQTTIQEWAHADRVLRLASRSIALKRISSATRIESASLCCFERMTAPVIRFGFDTYLPIVRDRNTLLPAHFIDIPGAVKKTESVFHVNGDCRLHPGRTYLGTLIVTGKLSIGHDTTVSGDIKAHGGIVIGPYASVSGSVVCEKRIEFQTEALAGGPVISETEVILATGCRVGSPDHPTTVTAPNIIASEGCVAHGTVWARETGVVVAV